MKNVSKQVRNNTKKLLFISILVVLSLIFLVYTLRKEPASDSAEEQSLSSGATDQLSGNETKISHLRKQPTKEGDAVGVGENISLKNPVVDLGEKNPEEIHQHQHDENKASPRRIVKAENIPKSKFREQFEKLSHKAQRLALSNLSQIHDFKNDIASLNVDKNGMLFYTCKFKIDPKKEAAALAEAAAAGANSGVPAAVSVPISSPPVRHSKPGASKVLFLDFNGGLVDDTAWDGDGAGGVSYDCKPYDLDGDDTTFSDDEQTRIIELWAMVAEDFAPFDVDVTTEEPAVWTDQTGWCMITETVDKNGRANPHYGYGGIAYVNVFGRSGLWDYAYYSPAWVTEYSSTYAAEAAAHELGHNLGLSHDGQSPGDGAYYHGHDGGVISWGAIMGGGVTPDVTQWSKGEYYNANQHQDDLAIISGKLAYRADDHGDTDGTASVLNIPDFINISDSGIIETTDDPDVFSFTTGAGAITINANAYKNTYFTNDWGANLDINLELYNSVGTLVASNNPTTDVDATINYTAAAGTYYLHVKPSGVGSPLNNPPTGYTSYGSLGQYTLTGTVQPPAPAFTINNVTVTEGDAGTVNAVFDVTLTNADAPDFPLTVDFATADNNAKDENNDGDYQSQNNTLTFNANETQQVTILVNGDVRDEVDETFYVNLSNPSGSAVLGDSQGVGTITDDDPEPTVTLSVDNANIAEAGGVATFTATLSAVSGKDVTVNLGFTGTATGSGTDYTASGASISITAGNTTGTVTVTTDQDALDEENETVIVDITSVTNGTENGTQQQTTSITDDDLPPTVTLSRSPANIAEASGVSTLTALLSGASGKTVTVDLAYTGTATGSGTDYTASGTLIVITPGNTDGAVTVTAVQDALDEVDETIIVDIDAVTNGTEDGTQQQIVIINDDDPLPTISIDDVTVTEGDAGTVNARFTVSLDAVSAKTVTVDYTTTDSSATTGDSDYVLNTATLTFNPGDTTKTIDVTVNGDFNDENNEEYTIDLTNPGNATISDAQGVGTITDDDDSYDVTVDQGTGDGSYVDGVTVTITADADPTGLTFDKWTGSVAFANENAASTTFTMPASDTTVTATYTVDPASAEKITYGSVMTINASDVSGMDNEFTARPRVSGKYTDPVRLREYNASTRGITRVSKNAPSDQYQCEWSRKVGLYNKTDLRNANRAGTSTADWLTANPISDLDCMIRVNGRTANNTRLDVSVRGTSIVPPEITSIERWDGGSAAGGIHPASILVVKGNFFGSKAPIVGIEYTDARTGAVKQQRLKVVREMDYDDYRGNANKSYMNLTSGNGESTIRVEMPKKWWRDWAAGSYDLVLNNGVGVDTVSVATIASATNNNPVANNDAVTLYPGEASYYIDVLADNGSGEDEDADSDKMTIVLGSKTSTLGGRLALAKGKVRYTPPKAAIGAFPDTFTYTLTDSHGGTSGAAAVTVNMPAITLDPIKHWDGTALGARTVQPGSWLIISGSNFGTKVPTVKLAVENGKTLKLKVISKAQFDDYNNKANRSYTNLSTGASQITVEMPKRAWVGYTNSKAYTITVSNKLDTTGADETVTTSAGNSAPSTDDDAVTIYSGSTYYLIDVLADNGSGADEDDESDKMTIVLTSRTSTLGGRLSVDTKTNQVKYYRAKDNLCGFTDTFTYSLKDASGAISGTATVTITGSLNP